MIINRLVRSLLGETTIGVIDYYRRPERGEVWGGPFNGQSLRKALFGAMVDQVNPAAIIETGTYLGTTTEFMALTGLPVFTIEQNARNYGFAKARLWSKKNVTIRCGDSPMVLRSLFENQLRSFEQQPLLAYLDAHWNVSLPLAEELDIVFHQSPLAVVMIDDFQVPFDAGYGYDDYGPGKALTPAYIATAMVAHKLEAYFPSTPSTVETGERRGCIVLATEGIHSSKLSSIPLLQLG